MITVKDILNLLGTSDFAGNEEAVVREAISMDPVNSRTDVVFWCNLKSIERLNACSYGTVICPIESKDAIVIKSTCNYLFVANPRLAFISVLNRFFINADEPRVVSQKASIHPTAKIGKNVAIGDFTIIEKDVQVGDDCVIGYNNVLHHGTILKTNVKIGSNNTIGGVGFGYEKNEDGDYKVFPHIGNVVISEDAEIGNNNCIDRAVIGSTRIGKNVKIDNLVHVAHGVVIDENSLIIAHTMIGGSSAIGKNSWISPGALIINKTSIGDNTVVGMGAVVIKPVESNSVVAGNPSRYLNKEKKP